MVTVSASGANRERVSEVWRSRYGRLQLTGPEDVDQRDGSVWVIEGATVTHLSRDGDVLGRTRALPKPCLAAADPADGTCWVAQWPSGELTHIASNGAILSTTPGFAHVLRLAVSSHDGSVWVLGQVFTPGQADPPDRYLAHVSAGGHELSRVDDAVAVVVDSADGSAWACSEASTVRLRADGTQLWTAPVPGAALDEDARDQSVWVVSQDPRTFAAIVTHLSPSGQVLSQTSGPASKPTEVHVSHTDGSAWVTCSELYLYTTAALVGEESWRYDYTAGVVRFDSSGAQAGRLDYASMHAWNDLDGSVWVYRVRDGEWELAQYSSGMHEMRHLTPRESLVGWRAYDQTENTFWTTEEVGENLGGPWELQRLGPDGTVLWHERMPQLYLVSPGLDPRDGSIWATDQGTPGWLVHYSPEGVELGRRPLPDGVGWDVETLLISPLDGSWWITAWDLGGRVSRLFHVSADGALLSTISDIGPDLALDERDGSVWGTWVESTQDAAGEYQHQSFIHHLAADGSELLTKEYPQIASLAGTAADGSVWILLKAYPATQPAQFDRVSATGEVIASVTSALPALCGRVSPIDGSFYVAAGYLSSATGDGWVGQVNGDGSVRWVQHGLWCPQILPNPDDGSLWVADQGNTNLCGDGAAVVHYAPDGTARWREEAFGAPWPSALDRRDGSVWIPDGINEQLIHLVPRRSPFIDIAEDHWAFDEIVACFEAGLVTGFRDETYRPTLPIARDAMAVYIARAVAGADGSVPSGPAAATFADVPNTGYGLEGTDPYWAYRYIEYCMDQNIVQGYDPTHYRPSIEVDRGQMAVFVARSLVVPGGDPAIPAPPTSPSFHDVTAENEWAWCYPHVEYCAASSVVQGYSPGLYRPELIVTRDQMAVYIARAFALP